MGSEIRALPMPVWGLGLRHVVEVSREFVLIGRKLNDNFSHTGDFQSVTGCVLCMMWASDQARSQDMRTFPTSLTHSTLD